MSKDKDNNNKARQTALLRQLDELERDGFFGDVVLHISNGVLGARIDVRDVIDLDKPKSRPA